MFTKDLAVVILAAGKGKRMNNPDMPKVMALLNGKPLVEYVISQVKELNPLKIILVVGHHKEMIIDYFNNSDNSLEYALQLEQLGTGHAVAQAESALKDFSGNVLILAGDAPLIQASTLMNFIAKHFEDKAIASDLTAIANDPTGYGRIVRNNLGDFIKIVEQKDASDEEKLIKEINSGIFCVDSKELFPALAGLKNNNAQGEYYLTDIIDYFIQNNKKVIGVSGADFDELQGINTIDELKKVEDFLNSKK
jgi:UDP-N-acetylglucosamine pyrophosphorylase